MNRDSIIKNITKLECCIVSIESIIDRIDMDIRKVDLYNQIDVIQDKINYLNYLKDNDSFYDFKIKISPTSSNEMLCILLHKKGCTKRVRLSNVSEECISILDTLIDNKTIYAILYNSDWSKYLNIEVTDELSYVLNKVIRIV